MTKSVSCYVYRSKSKTGMYVYLSEKDNFELLPDDLITRLGTIEFTFSFELTESRKLAQLDAKQVLNQMQEKGFFLQMTPPNTNFLDLDLAHSDGF